MLTPCFINCSLLPVSHTTMMCLTRHLRHDSDVPHECVVVGKEQGFFYSDVSHCLFIEYEL